MPKLSRTTAVLAAAVALSVAAAARAEQKIATINPVKVLNSLAETKDINNAMNGEQQTIQQQYQDRQQKVKDLQSQRDQLKPDAPQWADLNKQCVQASSELQAWAQTSQMELARKFRENAKRMNEKIQATVAQVAKEKGIDLVIAEQKPEVNEADIEKMNPQQYMGLLFSQNVLYKSDTVDLTQDVIAKLDSEYKKH